MPESTIGLDDLIALNDEIAALARAGMPLERGLSQVGEDLPGKLGAITTALGERLSRGESLADALAAEGSRFPRLYRAVVEAGVRAGRLPAALEGVANYARHYAEARRAIGAALFYPLIVVALASGLFTFLVTMVLPRFAVAFNEFRIKPSKVLNALLRVGEASNYWVPLLPLGFVLIVVLWLWSGRAAALSPGRSGNLLRWMPWAGPMLAQYEAANFADLLALLLEHNVPYPDAIVLCSEASGDPVLAHDGGVLASEVAFGESPRMALRGRNAFPPLLRWLLATGQQQGDLVTALRHMAGLYRRRARHLAETIRLWLPMILLFVIGATATLVYALTLFIPFTSMLQELARG